MSSTRLSIALLMILGVSGTPLTPICAEELPPGAVAQLGSLKFRHGWEVQKVIVSPDRGTIFSCTPSRVYQWEAKTGRLLKSWDVGGSVIPDIDIALSPDGKTLAVASWSNNKVDLWDVDTTTLRLSIETFRAEADDPDSPSIQDVDLTFTPDSESLFYSHSPSKVNGKEQTIRVYSVSDGKVKQRFSTGHLKIYKFVLSPDGKLLAAIIRDEHHGNPQLVVWDVKTGNRLLEREDDQLVTTQLQFSPDSQLLALGRAQQGGENYRVDFIDPRSGKLKRRIHPDEYIYHSFLISPDGNHLAALGNGLESVWVVDLRNGRRVRRMGEVGPWELTFTFFDNNTVISGGNHTLHWHELRNGKALDDRAMPERPVETIEFLPDGQSIAASYREGNRVECWDWRSGRLRKPLCQSKDLLTGFDLSPDGQTLITGHWEGYLEIRNQCQGSFTPQYLHKEGPWNLLITPDGQKVLLYHQSKVRLWDLEKYKEIWNADIGRELKLAVSPDGRFAAVSSREKTLSLLDLETGKEQTPLEGMEFADSRAVAFSPHGGMIAGTIADQEIQLWELQTRKRRLTISPPCEVTGIAFSADGRMLATINNELSWLPFGEPLKGADYPFRKAVHLWDVFTGELVARLEGHREGVTCLRFSPDGRYLATGSMDTTILVWDLEPIKHKLESKSEPLTDEQREKLWFQLADNDAVKAYQVMSRFIQDPDRSRLFLTKQLNLREPPPDSQLKKWLRELDSESFDVRERATELLIKQSPTIVPVIKQALARNPSPEVERRLRKILEKLELEHLRHARAEEVLAYLRADRAKE